MTQNSFISSVAHHILSHYDLAKDSLTVVFPNKRAALYLRQEIINQASSNIWMPEIKSIQEALSQWSGMTYVDTTDVLFSLIEINSRYGSSPSDISNFGSLATQMAKDFDEIDQYNADARSLFSYLRDAKELGVWNLEKEMTEAEKRYVEFFGNLINYYHSLRTMLEADNKGYYGMITRRLAEMSADELSKTVKSDYVLFAGFNALTPTEEIIIDKLDEAGIGSMLWDLDSYYYNDDTKEAGQFARAYAQRHNITMQFVENNLITNDKVIHLVDVAGNSVQARALQSQLVKNHNTSPTIVLADESLLIPVLNAIPDDNRYSSLEVSMGYPLTLSPLHHLIVQLFKLQNNIRSRRRDSWYLWSMFKILDLEIIKLIISTSAFEELTSWRIRCKEDSIYLFDIKDMGFESEELINLFKLLFDKWETPDQCLSRLCDILVFIASQVERHHGEGNSFLLNQISGIGRIINKLKLIIETHSSYQVTIGDIENLYLLVAREVKIKLNGKRGEGLQIMGLLETRNLDFETVHLLSVNEGILPKAKTHNSLIPYDIRKEFGLPTYHESQAVYAYHFYRLLQRSKEIFLYYNSLAIDSGGEASRFVLQLKHEWLPSNNKVRWIEEPFICTQQPKEGVVEGECLKIEKTDKVMQRIYNKIYNKDRNSGLSPTSLSSYLHCPLKFYLRFIERITDEEIKESMKLNVIGTLVHDTLESLLKDYTDKEYDIHDFEKKIMPSLEDKYQETIKKNFPQGLPNIGYNYLNDQVIHKFFDGFVNNELKELKELGPVCIRGLEKPLYAKFDIEGVPFIISGTADRIDERDGSVRIIDYKTGKVEAKDLQIEKKHIDDIKTMSEKALQLLIYKFLYLKQNQSYAADSVNGAIYALTKPNHPIVALQIKYNELDEDFINVVEALIKGVMSEILDPTIPFTQTSSDDKCSFCDYKTLCKRNIDFQR